MSDHTPNPPGWTCRACADPWPCAPRRAELLTEYEKTRPALYFFLASCMVSALEDLQEEPLHGRFLGWVPRRARSEGKRRRTEGVSDPRSET